ncbi:TPR domain protein [Tirmania nivea]|nr:TPR domain protein [Tirmania nivea]
MARNKGKSKASQRQGTSRFKTSTNPFPPSEPTESLSDLITTATTLLRTHCTPAPALTVITRALALSPTSLPALELAGEIHLELGDIPTARSYFLQAAGLDPDGLHEDAGGSGPEKFLWLAQLSEEGGREAVGWFERGANVLRKWVQEIESTDGSGGVSKDKVELMQERDLKGKLCSALCGMAEIYMTDLCMEPNAESSCEAFVTEALLLSPDSSEALQTLASIRISQLRIEDAKAALERSVQLWLHLEHGIPSENCHYTPSNEGGSHTIPPYATRMATTRLLMETELYDLALEVLDGLREEDDQVVDLWYLGGWGLYCKGERVREDEVKSKGKEKEIALSKPPTEEDEDEDWQSLWAESRQWLNVCAKVTCPWAGRAELYQALEWEDERLKEHTIELLGRINEVLGEEMEDDDDNEGEDGEDGEGGEWEDADSDGDEEMRDS